MKSGECYSWGNNWNSQLGLGHTRKTPCTLNKIIFDSVIITLVSCGYGHNIVLTKTNKCYVWGQNQYGQLGLGHHDDESLPQELLGVSNVIFMSCGGHHTVVLMKYEHINKCYIWGRNDYGQLGLSHRGEQNSPCKLKLRGIVSISCGFQNTMALTSLGKLYTWGGNTTQSDSNYYCQISPQEINFKESVKSVKSIKSIKSFHCGAYHTIFITTDDKIYVWGENYYGQLGLGDKDDRWELSELEFFNH